VRRQGGASPVSGLLVAQLTRPAGPLIGNCRGQPRVPGVGWRYAGDLVLGPLESRLAEPALPQGQEGLPHLKGEGGLDLRRSVPPPCDFLRQDTAYQCEVVVGPALPREGFWDEKGPVLPDVIQHAPAVVEDLRQGEQTRAILPGK